MRTRLWLIHRLRSLLFLHIVDLDHVIDPLDNTHFFANHSLKLFDVPHLLALEDLSARSFAKHETIFVQIILALTILQGFILHRRLFP